MIVIEQHNQQSTQHRTRSGPFFFQLNVLIFFLFLYEIIFLWVPIIRASLRCFKWVSTLCFLWRNKKNSTDNLSRAMDTAISQGGFIAPDKRRYPHNIFLPSPWKHMLWVLIRSTSECASNENLQYMFTWWCKKNISTFRLKKVPYLEPWWVVLFVCVEVLWPSQPNGVISSVISLPNHTFTGQA